MSCATKVGMAEAYDSFVGVLVACAVFVHITVVLPIDLVLQSVRVRA